MLVSQTFNEHLSVPFGKRSSLLCEPEVRMQDQYNSAFQTKQEWQTSANQSMQEKTLPYPAPSPMQNNHGPHPHNLVDQRDTVLGPRPTLPTVTDSDSYLQQIRPQSESAQSTGAGSDGLDSHTGRSGDNAQSPRVGGFSSAGRHDSLVSHRLPGLVPPQNDGSRTPFERLKLENAEDTDDGEIIEEVDASAVDQTPAERLASRRKMKRFRLTHQQTRFLMSEFAKQPHPDAAHRERLSREIPGLSPRQVQVWFQNRRAKIKRLTIDDRERMLQMRAVPDGFDNVQALHSPYGAMHRPGMPHAAAPNYEHPSYRQSNATSLMIDVQQAERGPPFHTTELTPLLSGLRFQQGAVMGNPSAHQEPMDRHPYLERQHAHAHDHHRTSPNAAHSRRVSISYSAHQSSKSCPRTILPAHGTESGIPGTPESLHESSSTSSVWKPGFGGFQSERGNDNSVTERHQHWARGDMHPEVEHSSAIPSFGSNCHDSATSTTGHVGFGYQSLQMQGSLRPRTRASPLTLAPGLDGRDRYPESQNSLASPVAVDSTSNTSLPQQWDNSTLYPPGYQSSTYTSNLDLSASSIPAIRASSSYFQMNNFFSLPQGHAATSGTEPQEPERPQVTEPGTTMES